MVWPPVRPFYVPAYWLALIHIGLGEKEQALAALEQAYTERHWMITLLKVDPRLDPLRSEPQFQALLRRMNFPK